MSNQSSADEVLFLRGKLDSTDGMNFLRLL